MFTSGNYYVYFKIHICISVLFEIFRFFGNFLIYILCLRHNWTHWRWA